MTNLFVYRATDPADMKAVADPVGSANDRHLVEIARYAGIVVAASGADGVHKGRDAEVRSLTPNLDRLRKAKHGAGGGQHCIYASL